MRNIKNLPMSSAPFVYNKDGSVAWNNMWKDFCYLAVEGGPPHRNIPLTPKKKIDENSKSYRFAVDEILRAYSLLLPYKSYEYKAGWIAIHLYTPKMARWYSKIINTENVECIANGSIILLPVNDDYTLEKEIKNVVTVAAKAYHYWKNHRMIQEKFLIALFGFDVRL